MNRAAPFTRDELIEKPWLPRERVAPGSSVVRSDRGVEVIGYNACAALLRNTDFSTGLVELFDLSGVAETDLRDLAGESLNYAEGADHARLRTALGSFFTPARVAAMRADVRVGIEGALDALAGRTQLDIMRELVRDVPGTLFARLLGLDPEVHRDFISHMSEASVRVFEMDPSISAEVTLAWRELTSWVEELIDVHTASNPGDNVVDHLLAQKAAGNLSDKDVRASLATLLAASTDTTQILAGCMFWAFADHPDQWRRLRANPALAASAISEAARYRPGDAWIFRVATVDTTVDGVPVSAGEHVFACIGAAHRDPGVFTDPDVFDIGRTGERAPLNWGMGWHFCMGRMFAVMELEELLLATSRRWERMTHLDPVAAKTAAYLSVQHHLPIRVAPAL